MKNKQWILYKILCKLKILFGLLEVMIYLNNMNKNYNLLVDN